MTKKKPDFLRDLDTAIMDELTGGGIKENAAGLVGTLTQIEKIKQLCGLPFCGYVAKLETVRPSGVPDEVTVVFAEDVPYRACNGIEFDVMQEFVEGSRLLLTGKAQTLKDFQSGRLLVYILADFVTVSEKAVEQDEVAVRGVIANKPTHRETPRGKRITDITVKVRNELTGGSCFLPCICWQEQADEAAQWQQGDTVELLGRYQSRQYEKALDAATGEREQRTAYEVSVRLIRRKRQEMNRHGQRHNRKRVKRHEKGLYMQSIQGERRRRAGQKHRLCAAADTAGVRGGLSTHYAAFIYDTVHGR